MPSASENDLHYLIAETLDQHDVYTRIVYSDDDGRTGYICDCNATDTGSVLWGREWRIAHHAEVVSEAIHKALEEQQWHGHATKSPDDAQSSTATHSSISSTRSSALLSFV